MYPCAKCHRSKDEVEFSVQRCREGQRRASHREMRQGVWRPEWQADSQELQRGQVPSQRVNTNWIASHLSIVLD